MVIEAEKAKIAHSAKTLDNLIKATKERAMRRTMIKHYNESKKQSYENSRERPMEPQNQRQYQHKQLEQHYEQKPSCAETPQEEPLEIEDSIDFKRYRMETLERLDTINTAHYSEEDTPRRILPVPEPNTGSQESNRGKYNNCKYYEI